MILLNQHNPYRSTPLRPLVAFCLLGIVFGCKASITAKTSALDHSGNATLNSGVTPVTDRESSKDSSGSGAGKVTSAPALSAQLISGDGESSTSVTGSTAIVILNTAEPVTGLESGQIDTGLCAVVQNIVAQTASRFEIHLGSLVPGDCVISIGAGRLVGLSGATNPDPVIIKLTIQAPSPGRLLGVEASFDPLALSQAFRAASINIPGTDKILHRFPFSGSSLTLPSGTPISRINDGAVQHEWVMALSNAAGEFTNHFVIASAGGDLQSLTWRAMANGQVLVWGKFSGTSWQLRNKAGQTVGNISSKGIADYFLLMIDSNGAPTYWTRLGSSGDDILRGDLAVDETTGRIMGVLHFSGSSLEMVDSTGSINTIPLKGGVDAAFFELDMQLRLKWSVRIGSSGDEKTATFAYSPTTRRTVFVSGVASFGSLETLDLAGNAVATVNPTVVSSTNNTIILSFNMNTHALEWGRLLNGGAAMTLSPDAFMSQTNIDPLGGVLVGFYSYTSGPSGFDLRSLDGTSLHSMVTQIFGNNSNMIKIAANGGFVWHRRVYCNYSCGTFFPKYQVLSDGSVIAVGQILMSGGAGSWGQALFAVNGVLDATLSKHIQGNPVEAWVARYNNNGTLAWARLLGGANSYPSMQISATGDLYIASTYRSVDFMVRTPEPTTNLIGATPPASGTSDGYALKLNGSDGSVGWAYTLNGVGTESLRLGFHESSPRLSILGTADSAAQFTNANGTTALAMPLISGSSAMLGTISKDGSDLRLMRLSTAGSLTATLAPLPSAGLAQASVVYSGGPIDVFDNSGALSYSSNSPAGIDALVMLDLADASKRENLKSDGDDYVWFGPAPGEAGTVKRYYYIGGASAFLDLIPLEPGHTLQFGIFHN